MAALAAAPTPVEVVNTLTKIVSDDYATLLPLADIGTAFVITMPTYDATLFADQLLQGNLINAFGYPIAADVGLTAISGGVVALVAIGTLQSNIKDLQSLFP
ncbi:hypothetical protein MSHO_48420 [Mycobacterium shottsii]|uniref:PE family protein n=1 Tax=Mycobacterium shottsii TaxID=133549 RepID=A0A7I7LIS7_9MYCO|nr:hypothetical protein [Mycobacterium shottsii]BBX59497.1 hypothetical protein MSHO_48420 [Mycobacterium shottsii]